MDVKKAFFILVSPLILHIHDYRYRNDNKDEVDFDKISLLEPKCNSHPNNLHCPK